MFPRTLLSTNPEDVAPQLSAVAQSPTVVPLEYGDEKLLLTFEELQKRNINGLHGPSIPTSVIAKREYGGVAER
jgi:hypothetical protein